MNYNTIIFYDFETGSVNPHRCQPLQLAAIPIHGRKIEVINDTYASLIKPVFDPEECKALNLDPLEDKALEINGLTRNQLAEAPPLKVVWQQFQNFVNQYNYKKNKWTAPIRAGFNINRFDDIILDRIAGGNNRHIRFLNSSLLTDIKNKVTNIDTTTQLEDILKLIRKLYSMSEPYKLGPWNDERCEQDLFHPRDNIDLMRIIWNWTENTKDITSISMDAIREWLGLSTVGAHDARVDVEQGAEILCRFMKLTRKWASKTKWRS